jgi:hypothetical protein
MNAVLSPEKGKREKYFFLALASYNLRVDLEGRLWHASLPIEEENGTLVVERVSLVQVGRR